MGEDKKATILFIEDDPLDRELVLFHLKRENFKILVAENGTDGIKKFLNNSPDIILLDITLPDIDGFDVCAKLQEHFNKAYNPVIFLTAHRDIQDKLKGLEMNVLDYITKPFHPEELIARIKKHLMIKNLQTELQKARDEAETANLAKTDFLASISHEIRTPMNSILGFSHILKDQNIGKLNRKQIEYIDNIIQSGTKLLNLINNILDFSKIEVGAFELKVETFNIYNLMKSIIQITHSIAYNKDIKINVNIDPAVPEYIKTDSHKLDQILKNLVSNAVKFTDEGNIDISVIKQEEYTLLFSVKDTGIGISENNIPNLFKKFTQFNSHKYSGTGLGLAISKNLVEMMNGKIWVESIKDKGSSFFFTIKYEYGENSRYKSNFEEEKKINDLKLEEISIKTKEKLPEIIFLLENELYNECEKSLESQNLTIIESFGKKIKEIGTLYGIKKLSNYGNELLTFADSFNIKELMVALKSYKIIVDDLKSFLN
ncbi:MAG: response regulator [Desulfobacterales bacterium]|nr:response regulator [Desulfobacterales bacterium]